FFERQSEGHLDLPRARDGGFAGGFFAVFVWSEAPQATDAEPDPSEIANGYDLPLEAPLDLGYAQRVALAMMATLFRIEDSSNGKVKVVRTADELERSIADGTLAA